MSSHEHRSEGSAGKLADAGFDPCETALLHIARHYCLSYTQPARPYWELAIDMSLIEFGEEKGASVAVAIMKVLRAMRNSRQTIFRYTNPSCTICSAGLSHCERLLIQTIKYVRQGDIASARMEALILCEGHDVGLLMDAVSELVAYLPVEKSTRSRVTSYFNRMRPVVKS